MHPWVMIGDHHTLKMNKNTQSVPMLCGLDAHQINLLAQMVWLRHKTTSGLTPDFSSRAVEFSRILCKEVEW